MGKREDAELLQAEVAYAAISAEFMNHCAQWNAAFNRLIQAQHAAEAPTKRKQAMAKNKKPFKGVRKEKKT